MCRRVTCARCGKPSYAGCGQHIEAVLGDVPANQRCTCPRAVGYGDASLGYGVSLGTSGAVSWDSSVVYNNLPPGARKPAADAVNCVVSGSCDEQKLFHDTVDAIALALATEGGLIGIVAAGLLELVANFQPPRATVDLSYEAMIGGYDPGPPGSFQNTANGVLRAVYDGVFAKGGTSLNGVYAAMVSALSATVASWNASHAGPPAPYKVNVNKSTGWSGWQVHLPTGTEPIQVAANWLYGVANPKDVMPRVMVFAVNTGAAQTRDLLRASVNVAAPTAPSQSMSMGNKVAVAVGVVAGGGLLWATLVAHVKKKTVGEVLDRAWKKALGR